jgi:hypothetical protein
MTIDDALSELSESPKPPVEKVIEKEYTEEEMIAKLSDNTIQVAIVKSYMEGISFNESIKQFGLTEDFILSQYLQKESTDVAKEYVKSIVLSEFDFSDRKKGDKIYVIKKILCAKDDYEEMDKVISSDSNYKFKTIKLISSNRELIAFKKDKIGIEFYISSAKTALDALKKTTDEKPVFEVYDDSIEPKHLEEIDKVINHIFYKQDEETVKELNDLADNISF